MNEAARQLSDTIEAVSKALAEWTVNRHIESDPALPERYGTTWRTDWTANVQSRLAYLAQAVSVRRPELFYPDDALDGSRPLWRVKRSLTTL